MQEAVYQRTDIEDTMRSAYLSYAMSVITARALPDVRDGLKPVQRRILYAMNDMGLRHDRPTRKSARIVGEVLGKYHPHGDAAVYEAMVRMAQDFSMRYPLVDGQGNFGSVDGDGAAAVRYTEARLSIIGDEMLTDLDNDAVDMVDNFDGTLKEPSVLPARVPNLLVNGVGGIAVGMATNIPPHNLGEIADAVAYLIDHYHEAEEVTLNDLLRFVHGPDFPTGGTILGDEGIRQAYATGRGRVVIRSQVHPEELSGGRLALIVTELPYQVNKSTLVGRIATLAREGRVDGIGDLRDESDRMGIRIVIELKRGIAWEPVLADLLKYSQLQTTFGVNMLALVDGEPRTLSLKRALLHHIDHRYNVVERRSRHELERARQRAHVLEGLLIALDHLDEIIALIRKSQTADTAKTNLCRQFHFTEVQAQAILDLQLRRLAALERRRVQEEYREVMARIEFLEDLLSSETKIRAVVKDEILELKRAYGDPRRTRVSDLEVSTDVSAGDLVADADLVVAISAQGQARQYPASLPLDGPDGLIARLTAAGETIQSVVKANAQDKVVYFTNQGRAFGLGAHQIPDSRQQADGVPLSSLARLEAGEFVVALIPLPDASGDGSVLLATAEGRVKRVTYGDLGSVNRDLVTVMGLVDADTLVDATVSAEEADYMLVSAQGRAIRSAVAQVSLQGLPARGVKGMDLKDGDRVVSAHLLQGAAEFLLVTANGFAKRVTLDEYTAQGRGGQGIATLDASKSDTAGDVVASGLLNASDRVLFCTAAGTLVERVAGDIPRLGRDTWGRIVTRTRSQATVPLEGQDTVATCAVIGFAGGDGSAPTDGGPASGGEPQAAPTQKRSRSSRRPASSEAPAARTRKTHTRSAAAKDAAPAAESAAPSRKRVGSRTSKASVAPPASPKGRELASTASTPDETADAAPKPTRRRTSRSRVASAEPAATAPPAQAPDAPAEAAPKPTRRRTSRSRTASAEPTAPETTADSGATRAAPRRRTRSTAATVAARAPSAAEAVPAGEATQNKPRVTRARAGKSAGAPAQAEEALAAASRTRKKAPASDEESAPTPTRSARTRSRRASGAAQDAESTPVSDQPKPAATPASEETKPAPRTRRPATRVVRQSPQRKRSGD